MALPRQLVPIARRLPILLSLTLVAVLATLSGCKHHRSAYRPVIVEPGPPIAAPATVEPYPAPASPLPGFSDSAGELTSPPVAPPAGELAPADGEPGLNPELRDPLDDPSLSPAGSAMAPGGVRAPTYQATSSRQELRRRLEPFVDDPRDLFLPPKADRPWRYVVLHHSASPTGSYAKIDQQFRQGRNADGCGYHFVIGNGSETPDGRIEVAQRWRDQKAGAHCRNGKTREVNEYGIGICLVGDLDSAPPTARQVASARALVAYLRERYAIPSPNVGTHALLASGPTACPGKHFPTAAILDARNLASR